MKRTTQPQVRKSALATAVAVATSAVSAMMAAPFISAQEGGLEEIVVTARKQTESLQDVGLAVSAMSQTEIERTFARDLMDLASISPNLIIDDTGQGPGGVAAIFIRGIGVADVEKNFDPAVGVVADGIFIGANAGSLLRSIDLASAEVLRGPQGTLFGRNTIGGLINITRSQPTGELGGKVNVLISEDSQQDYKGMINFPAIFGGTLATKVSAMDLSGGGYFNNPTRNTTEGDTEVQAWSASALWNPNDNFQAHLIYDDIDDETNARPTTCFNGAGELFNFVGQPAAECNPAISDFHYNTFHSNDQRASVEVEAVTLNMQWNINENNKLVAIYGTREMEETSLQEFDNSAADLFRVSRPQTEEQESLEIRLESDFSWGKTTVGAYLWDSEYDAWQTTWFFGGFNDSPRTLHETENTAVFGQIDFDITDQLSLSLGGRWIDEEKTMCQVFTGRDATGEEPFYGNWPGPDYDANAGVDPRYAIKSWGACDSAIAATAQNNYTDLVTGEAKVFTGNESWDEFTPRVGLTYTTDNHMVYASYSEGFRSGGFNGRNNNAANSGPYEPENVESIELGFKTMWFNNTLQVNGAIFSVDYSDKQEDVILPGVDGAVTLTVVQNAAAASIDGMALETLWIPTAGLTLSANLGLLDSSYDDYMVVDGTGNALDKGGLDLRRAPDMTLTVGAMHEAQLTESSFLVSTIDYRWKDDYCTSANNKGIEGNYSGNNPGCNDAYGILDASISFESDNWRVSLYGKNLTDEIYSMYFLDVGGQYNATSPTNSAPVYVPGLWSQGTVSRPRNFGVELQIKF